MGNTMNIKLTNKQRNELELNYKKALENPNFKKLINNLKLEEKVAMKNTTKLEDSLNEMITCSKCKGIYECKNTYKGHLIKPSMTEEGLVFSYTPCKYTIEEQKSKNAKLSEKEINSKARMKDIDIKDKQRMHVIKWLDKFYSNFNFKDKPKGLYLYGNFGSGKTFLINALLNELKEKKNVNYDLIYYPEILRDLKADWDLYDAKMVEYSKIDILCIDDIGAEKVSDWSRDEVLGTILQSRMNEGLTTFFTSNLSLEELETHFAMSKTAEDKIKARRIMERIKQLSIPMEMIAENKRN